MARRTEDLLRFFKTQTLKSTTFILNRVKRRLFELPINRITATKVRLRDLRDGKRVSSAKQTSLLAFFK
jgi:hypothetical protein